MIDAGCGLEGDRTATGRFGMRIWHLCLCIGLLAAPVSWAEELAGDYVVYSLKMDGSKVKGSMIVGRVVDGEEVPSGYSLKRIVEFINEDCASGNVRQIKLGKKTFRKGKDLVQQNFRATCVGGPHRSIGADREAKVRVERQEDGRDLAVYSHWKDGDTIKTERYR